MINRLFGYTARLKPRPYQARQEWRRVICCANCSEAKRLMCVENGSKTMIMKTDKRERLEKKGWSIGDASDFLNLTV